METKKNKKNVSINDNFLKKRIYLFAVAFLCLVILISHTLYVIKTHQFPAAGLDEHAYMQMGISYYDIIQHTSVQTFSQILEINKYRQPLYGIFLSIMFLFTGIENSYKIALWTNVIFYLLSIIGIYFLSREFLRERASFLASLIFAFYGFNLFYLHFTYSETATTAFVVLALLFLAKSKYFFRKKEILLFSIFFTLGGLTRWVVPIFVAGPLLLSIGIRLYYLLVRKTDQEVKNFLSNVLIFLFVAVVPTLFFYYLPNINSFRSYVSESVQYGSMWAAKFLGSPDYSNVFSSKSVMYYFNILSEQTIFFWLIFVAGFLISCVRFKKYSFILLAFIVPYCVFTFGSAYKGDRFIVPIYPSMAIISAVLIENIYNRNLNLIFSILIVTIGFLNFLGSSWGIPPMGIQGLKDIVLPEYIKHPRRIYLTPIVWPPRPEEGNSYEIISAIKKDWNKKERFVYTALFDMSQITNGFHTILAYESKNIGIGVNIWGEPIGNYSGVFEKIKEANYVLVKNGTVTRYREGEDKNYDSLNYFIIKFNKVLEKTNYKLNAAYYEVKKVYIPYDKSTLVIFRKDREMTKKEWDDLGESFVEVDLEHKSEIISAIKKNNKQYE